MLKYKLSGLLAKSAVYFLVITFFHGFFAGQDIIGYGRLNLAFGQTEVSITFELKKGLNGISLAVEDSGLTMAEDLANEIPGCNTVKYWDAGQQKFVSYQEGSTANNFELTAGYPYFVTVADDTSWTLTGMPCDDVQFDLVTTNTTSVNAVTVPFGRADLTNAEELAHSIENCDTVWYWDAENQGYAGHPIGTDINNFPVTMGYPYFVNVMAEAAWGAVSVVALPEAHPTFGEAPLTVHLTADGEDNKGTIQVYRWDFEGDGTWDTYNTVATAYTHIYPHSGIYTPMLKVESSTGATASALITITVANGLPAATADITPSNGGAPLDVQLQGAGSDPDGTIVLYEWDFEGDGTYDYSSPTSGNTTNTYQSPGAYQAIFRVTDNEGATATASATATVISVGPSGSPTASGTANPSIGPAPLVVNFDGTGTDPDGGNIVRYEWDFTNDGTYDYVSGTSAATSYTYSEGRKYIAAFRVTDDQGQTGIDLLVISAGLRVGLSFPETDKTVNPHNEEGIGIDVTVNVSIPATLLIKNKSEETIRTIPVVAPTGLSDCYNWDGRDDSGFIVNDGVYYAVLSYQHEGETKFHDLTYSTGGQRNHFRFGAGCDARDNFRSSFEPFEDDHLPMTFRLCSAQKVTGFIGPLWGGADATRIRTLLNQEALPAGEHTVYWDGLDDDRNVAQPPPGDSLITGFWRYTLPDNAIYVTGGRPVITSICADPNYFSPFSEKCDQYGNGEGINLVCNFSESVASVTLRVYSAETGRLVRTITENNLGAGEQIIFWDGKNADGEYVDIGDYQIGVIAEDSDGNKSMLRYALVRIDY